MLVSPRYNVYALTIVLALTLDVSGALHVYGLGSLAGSRLALSAAALLVCIAACWIFVPFQEATTERTEDRKQRLSLAIPLLAGLLMLAAWLLTARDFLVFIAPNNGWLQAASFAAGALLLVTALFVPQRAIALIVLGVILGSCARVASFAAVPITPTNGDMLPLTQAALTNLLNGRSPYTTYSMPWELPLTYLPLTWLAYLPAHLLQIDIRWTNLCADIGVGAAIYWITQRATLHSRGILSAGTVALLLWAWIFLLPTSQHWTQATTAPITWALLAWLLALTGTRHGRGSALLLGLLGAASPLATVAAPFIFVHWLRVNGWRAALRRASLAAGVAAAFVLPFLLWAPEQFVFGALRWFNDNRLFPQMRWEMDNTWASQVGFSGAFWRRGLENVLKPIQGLLLCGLLALFWWRGAQAWQLAPFLIAGFLLFTVFNPVLWPYLYTPALICALIAVTPLNRKQGIGNTEQITGNRLQEAKRLPAPVTYNLSPTRIIRVALVIALWPILSAPAPGGTNATTSYAPDLDALLLEHGYTANILDINGLRGLRASQRSYATSVWSRDLDYAISGYAYPLHDMRIFRESIEMFLTGTTDDGVVPETIYLGQLYAENRQSWDSMPNLIHAMYVYVAKTGDRRFYRAHRDTILRVGEWIVRLDSDVDGLPDRDIFPYGYYDSVRNSVMHTYALAKFYSAFHELAALEETVGRSGLRWSRLATQLREGFHRTTAEGGYWLETQPWPIAWRHGDGRVVPLLETFGVFEALHVGLIGRQDGVRYNRLITTLHEVLPQLIDGPTPVKLTLGGYTPDVVRWVDPPVPFWMLDASAPWIAGLAVPVYARAGYPGDSLAIADAYTHMARSTWPPVLEFAAPLHARYGGGNSGDGGRAWDSAAWFMAIYGGHYGITMTPEALVVAPQPLRAIPRDTLRNLSYQGADIQLELDTAQGTYRIRSSRAIPAQLLPMGTANRVSVNGAAAQRSVILVLEPGREYEVRSLSSFGDGVQNSFTMR